MLIVSPARSPVKAARRRETAQGAEDDMAMQRLTVLLSARDLTHHRSLASELVERARRLELAGASVFEGVEGVGRSGRLHASHMVAPDVPVAVVIVDEEEALDRFLADAGALLAEAVVTRQRVTAWRA
jgi:hypothetical protein